MNEHINQSALCLPIQIGICMFFTTTLDNSFSKQNLSALFWHENIKEKGHNWYFYAKIFWFFKRQKAEPQTHIPVCSPTAIPNVQGMEFKVQRKAVHLSKQVMVLTLESSSLENLGANRIFFILQFRYIQS